MNLSKHFTLAEMTVTQSGINNTPDESTRSRLAYTASYMEQVRHVLNDNAIKVNSGYRSLAVNTAIGGSKTSSHMSGFAVDFTCEGFGSAEDVVNYLRGKVPVDQLIWEHPPGKNPWVHISFDPRWRGQVLEYDGQSYKPFKG